MFLSQRFVLPLSFLIGASLSAPVFAAPSAKIPSIVNSRPFGLSPSQFNAEKGAPDQSNWKYSFADEDLENRWSFRGKVNFGGDGEIRVVFGWKDAKNTALLRITRIQGGVEGALIPLLNGQMVSAKATTHFALPAAQGEIGLQKVGTQTRVLWNGNVVARLNSALAGAKFGTATRGAAQLVAEAPQPTENVVFRDDFMRAQGPDDKEVPGEWKVAGVWKTSGDLGPRSDAALNPNPFVFRAQNPKAAPSRENVARAGKWWWSDYSVSASVRATSGGGNSSVKMPLRAAIEAFSQAPQGGVRGEVDFSRGIVLLKSGTKILAQNRLAIEANQWHRLRLEPGPGTAKFWVDGVLCAQAPSQLSQGGVALRAVADGGALVDFDDVRVGETNGQMWGERALPDRFQKDRLMGNWASNAKSWARDKSGIWWHTGDFFGPIDLVMPLPHLQVGDGFEVFLAADPKQPGSGTRFQVLRPVSSAQVLAGAPGASTTVPLLQGEMPLRLHFHRAQDGSWALSGNLSGRRVAASGAASKSAVWGTKIGIRPLKGGKPASAPSLQAISMESATFERQNRAAIGVNITPVSTEIAREIGLSDAAGAIVDNVETDSPAKKAGVLEGDVIRGINGARVADVESMRAAVGAVKAGQNLKIDILRPQSEASGLDWARCVASMSDVLDYSFTAAPTDWRAARGTWNVAERWTCSPQWSFFSGQNDASPLLWSRFATRGDWTVEAYLATPMDMTRGERSPSDLNLTVGANGQDLASGYSFIFGGKNRSVNQIRRGDIVVWEKPFEMPPTAGDIHQDWFYVRLERRQTPQGAHFRYSVNGRVLADYTDAKPLPDGGHIGFWTQNGGLSIARVRLWHSGLREPKASEILAPPPPQIAKNTAPNGLGNWGVRGQGQETSTQLVSLSSASTGEKKLVEKTLQITNPRAGGDWTTYVTRSRFSVAQHPVLQWDYCVPSGVKVNLYAQIDGIWREIGFSNPSVGVGTDDSGETEKHQLGRVDGVIEDGKWHHARFDLAAALKNRSIGADTVNALAFAAPDHDYLRAGLGGNHRGATYWLRDFTSSQK